MVWIGKEKIGIVKNYKSQKIDKLYTALIKKRDNLEKEQVDRALSSQMELRKKIDRVNIVLDKELPYLFLKKIMYTANIAGFNKFKFVVVGGEGGF